MLMKWFLAHNGKSLTFSCQEKPSFLVRKMLVAIPAKGADDYSLTYTAHNRDLRLSEVTHTRHVLAMYLKDTPPRQDVLVLMCAAKTGEVDRCAGSAAHALALGARPCSPGTGLLVDR
jgi:hypothetical protein